MKHLSKSQADLMSAMALLVLWTTGCSSAIEAPASYERFNSPNEKFSIEYPTDWDADGGGKRGILWMEFSKGRVNCSINSNVVDSVIGDLMTAAPGGARRLGDVEDEDQLEAQLHDFFGQQFEQEHSGYEEITTETIRTTIGRMRRTEYRDGSRSHGYRATMVIAGDPVSFVFTGPESNWEITGPVFDKMLNSVGTFGKAVQ